MPDKGRNGFKGKEGYRECRHGRTQRFISEEC